MSEVAQSCPTLCDPMDRSPTGSSVHRIFQARVLEWIAILGEDKTHVRSSVSLHGPRRMGRKPVMVPAGFWALVRLEVTSLSLPCPPDCTAALLGGEVRRGRGRGLCSLELKRCTQCTWPFLWRGGGGAGSPRKLSRAPGAGLLGWGSVPSIISPLCQFRPGMRPLLSPISWSTTCVFVGVLLLALRPGDRAAPLLHPGLLPWLPQSPRVGGWRKSSRHHRRPAGYTATPGGYWAPLQGAFYGVLGSSMTAAMK